MPPHLSDGDLSDGDVGELRLLVRLHYALAVLTALFPLVTLPLLTAGVELLTPARVPPEAFRPAVADLDTEGRVWRNVLGKLAVGGVAAMIAVCVVHAVVLWYIGGRISVRRRWWLAMIFSALHLINVPLGTALSVFALTILGRPSVRQEFRTTSPSLSPVS